MAEMKLVPVEPTEEMLKAGYAVLSELEDTMDASPGQLMDIRPAAVWEAMLAASPHPAIADGVEAAEQRIGFWLAGALEDPNVCAEMKADIEAWLALASLQAPTAREGEAERETEIIAAYKRGAAWWKLNGPYNGDRYLNKAASDYADKTMGAPR